jgi:hypothetical protein
MLPELQVTEEEDAKLRAAVEVVKGHGAKRVQLVLKDGDRKEVWELRRVVREVQ